MFCCHCRADQYTLTSKREGGPFTSNKTAQTSAMARGPCPWAKSEGQDDNKSSVGRRRHSSAAYIVMSHAFATFRVILPKGKWYSTRYIEFFRILVTDYFGAEFFLHMTMEESKCTNMRTKRNSKTKNSRLRNPLVALRLPASNTRLKRLFSAIKICPNGMTGKKD